MSPISLIRSSLNQVLKIANLKLETLTSEKNYQKKLELLLKSGHFSRPIYSLPEAFSSQAYESIIAGLKTYKDNFSRFEDTSKNKVNYSFNNSYFTSPDAEILYTIIRQYQPKTIVEVGSGNSTKINRQAIIDGQLNTRLISIDPEPRTEITGLSDEIHRQPVEGIQSLDLLLSLGENDILFIDSSHKLKIGNDVIFLYLEVIPKLAPGVLIHIHDVFLPYEYPKEWIVDNGWDWDEQYLVQMLLATSSKFEVLWAGHYLQRTMSDFPRYFPYLKNRVARSIWLQVKE